MWHEKEGPREGSAEKNSTDHDEIGHDCSKEKALVASVLSPRCHPKAQERAHWEEL